MTPWVLIAQDLAAPQNLVLSKLAFVLLCHLGYVLISTIIPSVVLFAAPPGQADLTPAKSHPDFVTCPFFVFLAHVKTGYGKYRCGDAVYFPLE